MKKVLLIILIISLFSGLFFKFGCIKVFSEADAENEVSSDVIIGVVVKPATNTTMIISLDTGMYYTPFGVGSKVHRVVNLQNNLLISGSANDEPLLGLAQFVVTDISRIEISEIKLIDLGMINSSIHGIATGGDNYFYVLGELTNDSLNNRDSTEPSESMKQLIINKYSNDGEYIDSMIINEWHNDFIHGFAVANDGQMIIYGSIYFSVLHWNHAGINTYNDSITNGSYILTITFVGDYFIAEIYDAVASATSYYFIDGDTGEFTRIVLNSIDKKDLVPEGFFWIEALDAYFTT